MFHTPVQFVALIIHQKLACQSLINDTRKRTQLAEVQTEHQNGDEIGFKRL